MMHIEIISKDPLEIALRESFKTSPTCELIEQTLGNTALNNVKNHLEANVDVANPWALKWFASSDECSLIN